MVYNYNREKHAFDQRWTYLHKAYSHAGMSETAIADIYKFDKEEFNCTRRERELALVSLDSPNFEEGSCGLDLFALGYYTCDSYSTVPQKYAWIDQIQDEALYGRLLQLSGDDKELLTLVAFEGFSVREAAAVFHISVQAIYKRLKKIGRLLYG